MQMLKKIFSSENKYYLELDEKLDEIKESEVVQTAVKTAEKATEAVQDKISEIATSEPVKEASKATKEAAEKTQNKLASAIATEDKSAAKSTKPAQKEAKISTPQPKQKEAKASQGKGKEEAKLDSNTAKSAAEEKPVDKQSPADAGASSFDPPFWVAAMNNTNTKNINSDGRVAEQTFATDNLMPIVTKYRRRPGGSLDKFKNMAKTAKTPKR